ncbi:MAG: VOC family protein [Myxococcota bacterium]
MQEQKITPFLWFEGRAEEAVRFYVSLFPGHAKVLTVTPMVVAFELFGVRYHALNGGPHYPQTPAFSLYVSCADQAEVDRLWDAFLSNGGRESRCGWLQDRWGVSWQIIPEALPKLINDPDPQKAKRATEAMLGMQKIDVAALERAHAGK